MNAKLEASPTTYQFLPAEMFVGNPMDTAHLHHSHAITVQWRGGDRWAILLGPNWSSAQVWCEAKGEWEYEPLPSSRTPKFLARTRYGRDEALKIGARLAEARS